MTSATALEVFARTGALIRDGHFQYTSGRHGDTYVNKDALYLQPPQTSIVCRELAQRAVDLRPDAVVSPALGGIVLAQWTAFHLTEISGKNTLAIYAEKNPDASFAFRRGYAESLRGARVIVVEDILTTGKSAARVIQLTQSSGAEVLGLFALWNRGGITAAELGGVSRFEALVESKFESWLPKDCPMCRSGKPLNTRLGKATPNRS